MTAQDASLNVLTPGAWDNDADGHGGLLTSVLVTDVSDGTLNLAADGSFSCTPSQGFNDTDSFSNVANDGTGESPTVQLTATATNQPPVANAGSVRAGDGLPLDIALSFSDPDGPGPYVLSVVQGPENGALGSHDGDVAVTYTSTPGFIGTDSFQFRINDGELDSNVAELTIHVQHYPGQTWETRTPESLGLRSQKLDEFATRVGGFGTIVKDGFVVKAWGNQVTKADWASAAKPVLSTLLFFAANEEKIESTDTRVSDWVPTATGDSLSPDDQTLTFSHLANNTSGYARAEAPGEAWAYNDTGINLYAILLEAVFGESLDDAAVSRLADLQLQDGSLFTSRNGYGVTTSTRDFARIAWFWLNKGSWRGIRLLSETFFDQFMRPQVPADLPRTQASGVDYLNVGSYGGGSDQKSFGPGIYGFNWWYNDFIGTTTALAWPDAPTDMVMASGRFGLEMVIVLPSLNMVISHQGDWGSFDPGDPDSGVNQSLKLIVQSTMPPDSNIPRSSVDDSYAVTENQSLAVAAPGVLGNDTDDDGDPLTAVLVGDVSDGVLSLGNDGSVAYTPNTGFTGTDSFSYQASDGQELSDTATVELIVSAPSATVSVPDLVGLQFASVVPDGDVAWQVPTGFGAEVALSAERISTTFADIPLVASSKPGQVVVDPQNASWLLRNGDRPLFIAAPGDPEDFLYRGRRHPDGTRSGDQSEIIAALKQSGANGLYLMAVRSNGGDGDLTHNPFLANNPGLGFNENILHQWELWFSEMDANGIVIVFFIYDDGALLWDTGDTVGAEELSFVSALVNHFEHHRNIIWTVAEEYGERYSVQRISKLAAVIRSADDFNHPIAVHKNESLSLLEFAADPNIDQFSIQYNRPSPQDVHDGMLTAWAEAAGQLNLNLSENSGQGVGDSARRTSWAAAMGGAYVMVLGMDVVASASSDLLDLGTLADFMESAPINHMSPHDELAFAGAEWILADPGSSYVAYKADPAVDSLGLRDLSAGVYRLRWLDVTNRVRQVSEAEQLLHDYDLTVGAMTEVTAAPLEVGVVVSQSPAAGSMVPPETRVNLEIGARREQ